jgi:hypothetical protein
MRTPTCPLPRVPQYSIPRLLGFDEVFDTPPEVAGQGGSSGSYGGNGGGGYVGGGGTRPPF